MMKIEIHQKGKIVNSVEVEIPGENSYTGYKERKAIIESEVEKVRKIYPLGDLYLKFESKMNDKIIAG